MVSISRSRLWMQRPAVGIVAYFDPDDPGLTQNRLGIACRAAAPPGRRRLA
jgi:hypothetical protein